MIMQSKFILQGKRITSDNTKRLAVRSTIGNIATPS
jgi:hypothetical protein